MHARAIHFPGEIPGDAVDAGLFAATQRGDTESPLETACKNSRAKFAIRFLNLPVPSSASTAESTSSDEVDQLRMLPV
jgi:hypothetical protein